jgi:hypothetical protein
MVEPDEPFRLHRYTCGRAVEAVCQLLTHQPGWELRLAVDGALVRSQVCATESEALATSETWKLGMIERGWR